MCFKSSKLHDIKNGQVQDKKFKRTVDVSIKKLFRKWEGETLSK